MPHDMHGRKIAIGDVIKARALNTQPPRKVVGVVTSITEAETCSGRVQFQESGGVDKDYFNASESELILKADGSEPA